MKQYLDIVERVLTKGKWQENRTGIRTLAVPNIHFSHEMSEGYPLLTTKKMAFKTMCVELEGFIKGITDKRFYEERGCKIWREWANPIKVQTKFEESARKISSSSYPELIISYETAIDILNWSDAKKQYQKEETDLGPIYGYQWRNFNKTYPGQNEDDGDWNGYTDQLKYIADTLKTNPNDRRMVCSAWNPNQMHMMALPPCHFAFVVTAIDGFVHLHWTQRSADLMLGVPFNIASYALLLELLAEHADLEPGNLSGTFCNCHIYENQIEGAKKQLERTPSELPLITLRREEEQFDIFKWTHKDVSLHNYNPQDKINFGDVAV